MEKLNGSIIDRRTFLQRAAWTAGLGAVPVLTLSSCAHTADRSSDVSAVAESTAGKLRGKVEANGILSFKGIPYGGPAEGAGRFMPPAKVQPWSGIRDALEYGPKAMQINPHPNDTEEFAKAHSPVDTGATGENCLVLNVWTPALDGRKRPVFFYIHGGGFMYGGGQWVWYEGKELARNGDIVVLTVNHRLNAFGYLYLADVGGPQYAASGNVGQLDLVAALTWVRDNIAEFGGDPGNVTICGQSGGGSKVSTLLAMPAAKGLFHRAIIQSGPGLRQIPRDQATATAKAVMADLAVSNVNALRDVPGDRLVQTAVKLSSMGGTMPGGRNSFGPVVDGDTLPSHPFDPVGPAVSQDVPLIIGTDLDETVFMDRNDPELYTMDVAGLEKRVRRVAEREGKSADRLLATYRKSHPGATPSELYIAIASDPFRMRSITLAERKVAQHGAPVYMYWFQFRGVKLGGHLWAPHVIEVPFVFDHPDVTPFTGTDPARIPLADQMSKAWAAFARTGEPSHAGIPKWPAYNTDQRATMILDKECKVVNDPGSEDRKVWGS